MKINVDIKDGIGFLKIEGRLDTITAPDLDKQISELEIKGLVLDFENLDYISSAGLRVLLSNHKKFSKQESMKVINVKEVVMEVFAMTGFADILNIE